MVSEFELCVAKIHIFALTNKKKKKEVVASFFW